MRRSRTAFLAVLFAVLASGRAFAAATPGEIEDIKIRALINKMALNDAEAKQASEELWKIGQAAVPRLIEALGHPEPRVRRWSAATLGSMGDDRAVQPLIQLASKDADHLARAIAIRFLGEKWFDRDDVKKAILAAMEDPEANVASWAISTAQKHKYAPALPVLQKLIKNKDDWIRYAAVRALADMQGEKAIDMLKTVLREDMSENVRSAAVAELGTYFEREDVRDLIVQTLDDKNDFVKAWALSVIADHRYTPALPKVMLILQSDDEDLRYDALCAFVALKGQDSIDFLKRTMKEDKSAVVRKGALRSCTIIEPPTHRCFEVLIEGLKDPDAEVRELASTLLTKGFGQYFAFRANDTVGEREKAIWRWDAWYRANKDRLQPLKKETGWVFVVADKAGEEPKVDKEKHDE
jgi:HEAT repeat protein